MELFARFVEGIVKDKELTKLLAPNVYAQFNLLANQGYYRDLPELISLVETILI